MTIMMMNACYIIQGNHAHAFVDQLHFQFFGINSVIIQFNTHFNFFLKLYSNWKLVQGMCLRNLTTYIYIITSPSWLILYIYKISLLIFSFTFLSYFLTLKTLSVTYFELSIFDDQEDIKIIKWKWNLVSHQDLDFIQRKKNWLVTTWKEKFTHSKLI